MGSAARRFLSLDQPLLPIGDELAVVLPLTHRVPVRAHRRTVDGPPPTSGAVRRDVTLAALETRAATQQAVAYVRRELRALYRSRLATTRDASVTADDVEDVLHAWPDCPDEAKPSHGPQHWRGAVFRGKAWRQTGRSVPSTRAHLKATALPCWIPTTETP